MAFPEETVNIKMYGAFRTFTNAAACLLDHYLKSPDGRPVRTWHHGPAGEHQMHKHLLPKEAEGVQGYVLLVKHPLSWLESMRKYLLAIGQNTIEYRLLGSLWTMQSQALLDFNAAHDNAALFRYEVAMKHPKDVVETCAKSFGLEAVEGASWPNERMGRGSDALRHLKATKPETAVQKATAAEVESYKKYIDLEVCEQLGYRL